MKVICAGMSKTGTKTMQCALKDLGYNVYDYMENFTYLRDDWRRIMTKGGTTEDFRRMFENVDAVTDLPACYYWDEIHKAFPDAKIILMMRESEEVWMKSLRNQVKAGQNIVFRLMPFISLAGRQFDNFTALIGESVWGLEYQRNLFSEPQLNELQMRMTYRRHNSHVLQAAPKDKLLVFNVKEGWKPLCDFLGVPVPEKPFPRKNVRGNIVEDLMQNDPFFIRIQREMLFSTCLIAALVSYGIYRGGKFAWFTYNQPESCFKQFSGLLFSLIPK